MDATSAAPEEPGTERPPLPRDAVKIIALAFGTFVLGILVLVFWAVGEISGRATLGYFGFAAVSLALGFGFVFPWLEATLRVADLIDAGDTAQRLVRFIRRWFCSPFARWMARRGRNPFGGRSTLGLWLPFSVSLCSVGWLIYFTGGLVDSQFRDIPLLMFTLVVLLVDLPESEELPPAKESESGSFETADAGDAGGAWPGRRPFRILLAVVLAFYGTIVLLTLKWPWKVEEADAWADLIVIGTTVLVGIPLAIFGKRRAVKAAREGVAAGHLPLPRAGHPPAFPS